MQRRFIEKQYFWQQPLSWVIWGVFAMIGFVLMSSGLLDGTTLVILIAGAAGALWLMASPMTTEISEQGVLVRVRPFHRKDRSYEWSEIESCHVRKYSPLGEYGGWGIRFGSRGRAFNVSGNMGLQLVFHDGKRLLIGTRKPDEIRETLIELGK